ncbi:hypothetical protein [Halosimplex halobium]|uniref:hypothetical protein n=1 Tax=Halosimplex halobium TaxID=3396618 RepID=UPI003F554222
MVEWALVRTMAVAEVSRDRVEERLVALEDEYSGFPVNQTTLAVASDAYERAGDRCEDGIVDAYVQLYNDSEDVLLVERDGEWAVPHGEPATDERVVPGTEAAIREATGVDCSLTDLARVTILGVRDEDDPERPPVYRLIAVFVAETEGSAATGATSAEGTTRGTGTDGDPAGDTTDDTTPEGVRWHPTLPESAVPPH